MPERSIQGFEALVAEIRQCRICKNNPTSSPLPHEPRPVVQVSQRARICIAGQAPGLRVHKSGLPFDDASGNRLRDWMGIDRDTFYDSDRIAIVPMGFCFPGYDANGSDLPPRRECRENWHDRLFAQMPQQDLILVIGTYAQKYHLGKRRHKTVTETVQSWRDYLLVNDGPAILPLPHPSWRNTGWLKKNTWFETEVLPVLRQRIKERLSD